MLSKTCAGDDDRNTAPDEWREPPGYLGEAVRRAKLIPSRQPPPKG